MAQEIQKASALFNSELTKASTSPWKESTKDIHQTIQIIQTLQTHKEMMEPLGFLLEYYAAVFSLLLLPLFMPLILGFVRELKRYKKVKAGEVWEVDDSDSDGDEEEEENDQKESQMSYRALETPNRRFRAAPIQPRRREGPSFWHEGPKSAPNIPKIKPRIL